MAKRQRTPTSEAGETDADRPAIEAEASLDELVAAKREQLLAELRGILQTATQAIDAKGGTIVVGMALSSAGSPRWTLEVALKS